MTIGKPNVSLEKKQALALLEKNQLSEAKVLFTQISEAHPEDAEVWYMLGMVNGMLGLIDEAGDCCRKAIEIRPDLADAHRNLGNVLLYQGRLDEALNSYREAVRINPAAADIHCSLGNLFQQMGRAKEAEESYREALRLNPEFAIAYYNLGNLYLNQWSLDEARQCYEEVLRLDPGNVAAHVNLGNVLKHQGWREEALQRYREVLCVKPDNIEACGNMGIVLESLGRLDEALECYRRLQHLKPGHITAITGEASILARQGKFEAAYENLRPLLEKGAPESPFVVLTLASFCRQVKQCPQAIAMMERLLARENGALGRFERISLHFSLGKLYDAAGSYEDAFKHYKCGNQLKKSAFDRDEHSRYVDDLIQIYSKPFMAGAKRASATSQRPVFIIGMPRSGTSLVEQILASHPQIYGAGELEDIGRMTKSLPAMLATNKPYPQCMSELTEDVCNVLAQRYLERLDQLDPDAVRVTDKMPRNFFHLGLIALLFPGARIIHCVRNPFDTCLSCYFQNFIGGNEFADDLEDLGAYYLEYRRLMDHWRHTLGLPMMTIHYEELIADQKSLSRELVEFCGLEWDEGCLRFFENKRVVSTSSYDQVNQPLYKRSVERWRKYESHLEPLKKALHVMNESG